MQNCLNHRHGKKLIICLEIYEITQSMSPALLQTLYAGVWTRHHEPSVAKVASDFYTRLMSQFAWLLEWKVWMRLFQKPLEESLTNILRSDFSCTTCISLYSLYQLIQCGVYSHGILFPGVNWRDISCHFYPFLSKDWPWLFFFQNLSSTSSTPG